MSVVTSTFVPHAVPDFGKQVIDSFFHWPHHIWRDDQVRSDVRFEPDHAVAQTDVWESPGVADRVSPSDRTFLELRLIGAGRLSTSDGRRKPCSTRRNRGFRLSFSVHGNPSAAR